MTTALTEILQAYADAWGDIEPSKRQELLDKSWSEDGVYRDPTGEAAGKTAWMAHIAGFHASMPGHEMRLTSGASEHHGHIYFSWRLTNPQGEVVTDGVDFGTLDADGRIAQIVGFFGPPPAAT